MGRKRAEIEYDLDRQRNAVRARVSRLQSRMREDVETTRERVSERVPGPLRPAEISEHPKTLVGASFGAGLTAGFATGGNGRHETRRNGHEQGRPRSAEEEKQGLLASAAGSIIGYLQAEAVRQLKQAWNDIRGTGEPKQDISGGGHEAGKPLRGMASSGNGRS